MIIKNYDRQQLTNTLKQVYDTYLTDKDDIIATASASLTKQIENLQQNLNFSAALSGYTDLSNTLSDSLSAFSATGNVQDLLSATNCCSGTPSLENTMSFQMLEGLFVSAANIFNIVRGVQNSIPAITTRAKVLSANALDFASHVSSNWNTLSANPDAGNFIVSDLSGIMIDMTSYTNTITSVLSDFSTLAQSLCTNVSCCSSNIPDNTFLSSIMSVSSNIKMSEQQMGATIKDTQDKIKDLIQGLTKTTENFK